MKRIRPHLTYANVMATLALFVALGGSSYAALRIGSRDIANNSLLSEDIRNNALTSRDIRDGRLTGRDLRIESVGGRRVRESSLGPVPNANRLGGATLLELKLRCQGATTANAGICIEGSARAGASFPGAESICANAGRRLPTYLELFRYGSSGGAVSAGGEWTSSVYRNPDNVGTEADELEVAIFVPNVEGVGYRQAFTPDPLPFRCVALPSN